MRKLRKFRARALRWVVAAFALAVTATPVAAQGSYSPFNETATAALARYVRELSSKPHDFDTLIGAGRAALAVGDTPAAAAFFARADEETPRNWKPQAGMAAVAVANGEAQSALPYFTRALQLGAKLSDIGADRGLAYDLLGRQLEAQADYRAALSGPDRDDARARLALSLAIAGKRAEALSTLEPLTAKRDPAGARARAFVLALTGDPSNARLNFDSIVPGSAASIAPFLARLPALNAGQKAAAVNLGIFPDSDDQKFNFAATSPAGSSLPAATQAAVARPSPVGTLSLAPPQAAPVVAASLALPKPAGSEPAVASAAARKIWLQLASGSDRDALGSRFARIKATNGDLLDGIRPYVAQDGSRSRLLIGPFRSASDADTFASDLESANVSAFKWKNSESDLIVPLGTN